MEASSPAPSSPDPVARSNKIVMIVGGVLLAVVVILILFFLLRTSPQQKALQAVCTARVDISKSVENLAATDIADFTLDGFKADVNSIRDNVQTIKKNEAKLKGDRKAQIQQANSQFGTQVTKTLAGLGTSISVNNAKEKLEQAGRQLIESYEQTLAPVDCSGVKIND